MKVDCYRTYLLYQGRPGLLELQPSPIVPRGRGRPWRWRFVGCSKFWRTAPSKISALCHAAWSSEMSAERAQWFPLRPERKGAAVARATEG